jgi:hypothetical protein
MQPDLMPMEFPTLEESLYRAKATHDLLAKVMGNKMTAWAVEEARIKRMYLEMQFMNEDQRTAFIREQFEANKVMLSDTLKHLDEMIVAAKQMEKEKENAYRQEGSYRKKGRGTSSKGSGRHGRTNKKKKKR